MPEKLPTPAPIVQILSETPTTKTFFFEPPFTFVPGQFVMVWAPGSMKYRWHFLRQMV